MDRAAAPALLPVFRSRQQADLLAFLLADPDREISVSDLAHALGIPYPSTHREIVRAERAGIVVSRKLGNLRLVKANEASPYFEGLSDVLLKAFGPPQVVAEGLAGVEGLDDAWIFGSWASQYVGEPRARPVGDIDVLVIGSPDRDALYRAAGSAERRLGRPVQVTIRETGWLEHGSDPFHATVTARPLVRVLPTRLVIMPQSETAARHRR